MKRVIALLLCAAFALPAAAADVRPVPTVDLQRYAGRWYEQARFPMFFQRKCASHVTADYTLRQDGFIQVDNRCRTADGDTIGSQGIARRTGQGASTLEVRFAPAWLSFLPFVWGDYWIIGLDPDYRWAVVGSPDRDTLWILSRTPQLDAEAMAQAEAAARANGFDTGRLVATRQE